MNPDQEKRHTRPYALDFSKKIKPNSPEYYSAYTIYNTLKVIEYYNRVFDSKIDFNTQKEYKTIEVLTGDVPLITHPDSYIFNKNSNPSPSLFAHETGHRAFWYLEDASQLYKYPLDSSFTLRNTFRLMEESFPAEIQNPGSNISKILSASYAACSDYVLDNVYDIYQSTEPPRQNMIDWYDVFYGLIQKDKELFGGQNIQVITDEFARTGYPVEIVKSGKKKYKIFQKSLFPNISISSSELPLIPSY